MTDRDRLLAYVEEQPPITDNRPTIEYTGWTRKDEFPRVLTEVSRLNSPIPLSGAPQDSLDAAERHRQKLWTLYRAGYYTYLGDEENWQAMLKRIVPELKTNPYFAWFVPVPR